MNISANIIDVLNSIVVSNENFIELLKKFNPEFNALKGVKFSSPISLQSDYYSEFNLDEIESSLSTIYKEHLDRSRYSIKVNQNIAHTSYINEVLKECNYRVFKTYELSTKHESTYTKYLEAFTKIKDSFYVQAFLVIKNRFVYSICDKYRLQVLLEELNKVLLCLDSYKYIDTMIKKIDLDLGEELEFLERCVNILINILSKLICIAIKEWNLKTKYSINIDKLLASDSFKERVFYGIESLCRLGVYSEAINMEEYKELRDRDYKTVGDYYKEYKKNLSMTLKDLKRNPNNLFIIRNYKDEFEHKTLNRVDELIDLKICLAVNTLKFKYLKLDRSVFIERYKDIYQDAKYDLTNKYKKFNKARKLNDFILENRQSTEVKYFNNIISLHELLRLSLICRAMNCSDDETEYIIENVTIMFKNYVKWLLLDYSKIDLRNILYFNKFNQTILNLDEPLDFIDSSEMLKILDKETA